jgi:hypothetical protein
LARRHGANEIRDETNREMETLGFEWRRKTKLTNRARESHSIPSHPIPSHPSKPGVTHPHEKKKRPPTASWWISTRPQLGRRRRAAEVGRPYGRGRGSGSRVGVRTPRRSGQGGRRRRGLGGSWLGLVVDWRETRRGARVGGGGGERSRSPATRVQRWCPCVPPLCPVVELTYRVVCLPEHQCATHTAPFKFPALLLSCHEILPREFVVPQTLLLKN